ncbi:MAG: NAD-dependent epimerase/dehydratase family protein [Planctomycetota bacterium]
MTGGLGFIGSNLVHTLVDLDAKVTIVDALIRNHGGDARNVESIAERIHIHVSDLRDVSALRLLVKDQDVIFHLAGQVSHGDSMRDPELDLAVNCLSTINLLEACRHNNPRAVLLYASTRQVYGRPVRLPVDEDHPTVPVDVNGINKLAAEYYHILYHRTYELPSVVLRLTNTYGPRQQIKNDRQGFTGVFLRRAMRGEKIQVFGDGKQRRDFNHVDDVVRALLVAAATEDCRGRIFNLGAVTPYSLNDFISTLRTLRHFEVEHVPFPNDRRLIDIGDYYGDWARFAAATGWRPQIELKDGLASTIDFFEQHAEVYLR